MKIITTKIIAFLLIGFNFGSINSTSAQTKNLANFNNDWFFTLSDSPNYSLTTYQQSDCRELDLPDDWTIELGFDESLEGYTYFMPGGIGLYN